MRMSDSPDTTLQVEGTMCRVNTISRELNLFMNGGRAVFDVPPDCKIILRGERVRLRMVQARDIVRVTYMVAGGHHAARTIDVLPRRQASSVVSHSDGVLSRTARARRTLARMASA
jgi:hypothetical protein